MLSPLLKQFRPKLKPSLEELFQSLQKYLKSIPLRDYETHATVVFDTEGDRTLIIVCTFSGSEFSRIINKYDAVDFSIENLDNLLS